MGERRWSGVTTREPVRAGTCFGPLPSNVEGLDPLASIAWLCTDRPATTHAGAIKVSAAEGDASSWLCHITPARGPHEQTLEVIAQEGQLFFRATRNLAPGDPLLAWFGKELADLLRLPEIPPTLVDGEKAYRCILCSEAFAYPFPVISHLMYRCPARHSTTLVGPHPERQSVTPAATRRVKGFDIASLTDTTQEDHGTPPPATACPAPDRLSPDKGTPPVVHQRTCSPGSDRDAHSSPDVKRPSLADQLRASLSEKPAQRASQLGIHRHAPSSTPIPRAHDYKPDDLSRPNKRRVEEEATALPPQSAFKKVDKTDRTMSHQPPNGGLAVTAAFPYPIPGICPPFLTMSPLESRLKSDEDAVASRRFLAAAYPPLVPYMPPSLTALSLPSQNWCAKCQASFRMTSDLVYHMRSHHKREVDPAKKRREEKLRCHICHETFRERHHLTRHMTSHQ